MCKFLSDGTNFCSIFSILLLPVLPLTCVFADSQASAAAAAAAAAGNSAPAPETEIISASLQTVDRKNSMQGKKKDVQKARDFVLQVRNTTKQS